MEKNGCILRPPVLSSYTTFDFELDRPAPSPPDARHWLGTDDQARDVLARVIYGFRISVLFGLLLTVLSSVIGVAAGAVQGRSGERRVVKAVSVRVDPGGRRLINNNTKNLTAAPTTILTVTSS